MSAVPDVFKAPVAVKVPLSSPGFGLAKFVPMMVTGEITCL